MNRLNLKHGTWLGGATAAVLFAGTATAFAQAATAPSDTSVDSCSSGSAASMARCQNMISNQQNDATVGNGASANSPARVGGVGNDNGIGDNINTGAAPNVSSGANAPNPNAGASSNSAAARAGLANGATVGATD